MEFKFAHVQRMMAILGDLEGSDRSEKNPICNPVLYPMREYIRV